MGIITNNSSVGSWANKNKDEPKVNIPGQGYSYVGFGGVGYEVSPSGQTKIVSNKNRSKRRDDTTQQFQPVSNPQIQEIQKTYTQQELLNRKSTSGVSVESLKGSIPKPNPQETSKLFLSDVGTRIGQGAIKIVSFITPNLKGDYSRTQSEEDYRRSQIDLTNAKQVTTSYSQTPVSQSFLEENKFYEVSAEDRIQQKQLSLELGTNLYSQEEVDKANLNLENFSRDIWKDTNIKVAKRDAPATFVSSAITTAGLTAITTLAPPVGGALTATFLTSGAYQLSQKENREWIVENPKAFAISTGAGVLGGLTGGGLSSWSIGKIKTNKAIKDFESAMNTNQIRVIGAGYTESGTGINVKAYSGAFNYNDKTYIFETKTYTGGKTTVGQTQFLNDLKSRTTFISKGTPGGTAYQIVNLVDDTKIAKDFGKGFLSRTIDTSGRDTSQGFAGINIGKYTFFRGGKLFTNTETPTSYLGYDVGARGAYNVQGVYYDLGSAKVNLLHLNLKDYKILKTDIKANVPTTLSNGALSPIITQTLPPTNVPTTLSLSSISKSFSQSQNINLLFSSAKSGAGTGLITSTKSFSAITNLNIPAIKEQTSELKIKDLSDISVIPTNLKVDTITKTKLRSRSKLKTQPSTQQAIAQEFKINTFTPIPNVYVPSQKVTPALSLKYYSGSVNKITTNGYSGGFPFPFRLNLGSPYSRRIAPSFGKRVSRTRYTPSYGSVLLNLKAPSGYNTRRTFTGLELRPMVVNNLFKRKKSRKRRK